MNGTAGEKVTGKTEKKYPSASRKKNDRKRQRGGERETVREGNKVQPTTSKGEK